MRRARPLEPGLEGLNFMRDFTQPEGRLQRSMCGRDVGHAPGGEGTGLFLCDCDLCQVMPDILDQSSMNSIEGTNLSVKSRIQ